MKLIFLISLSIFAIECSAQDAIKNSAPADTSKKQMINIDSETFLKVEIESSYPGGQPAWNRFLMQNMRYPDKAIKKNIQGIVVVQFIVDKEGNVTDVLAVSGPEKGGLREEAVLIIKLSGKWTPAIQFGRTVKSYKKQPFVFKLDN